MQIGKLNLGQLLPPVFGAKHEQPQVGGVEPPQTTAASASEPSMAQFATYRQILANYDVTHITPQQFSQLIRELHSAGAINDEELRELASVRFELDRAEVESDDPVNLLEMFAARLEHLLESESNAATGREVSGISPDQREQTITLTQRQLEWLQKFAALHADTARDGMNTLV